MLYLYDQAIRDDLMKSLDSDNANPNVFITDAENYPGILAQIQDDTITYPLILIKRDDDMAIDTQLAQFTRYQFGVPASIDKENNLIYYERALPVKLSYTVRILSHNVVDTDEMARELFYKYISMYYLTIRSPYESDRKMRFGLSVDMDAGIQRESSSAEYLTNGALYQSTIRLNTEGCVSLTYTSRHLTREVMSTDIDIM